MQDRTNFLIILTKLIILVIPFKIRKFLLFYVNFRQIYYSFTGIIVFFFFVFENFAQVLRQKIITTYTENSSEIYVTC